MTWREHRVSTWQRSFWQEVRCVGRSLFPGPSRLDARSGERVEAEATRRGQSEAVEMA